MSGDASASLWRSFAVCGKKTFHRVHRYSVAVDLLEHRLVFLKGRVDRSFALPAVLRLEEGRVDRRELEMVVAQETRTEGPPGSVEAARAAARAEQLEEDEAAGGGGGGGGGAQHPVRGDDSDSDENGGDDGTAGAGSGRGRGGGLRAALGAAASALGLSGGSGGGGGGDRGGGGGGAGGGFSPGAAGGPGATHGASGGKRNGASAFGTLAADVDPARGSAGIASVRGSPFYVKTVFFRTPEERTEFVSLVRAANVLGPSACRVFRELDADGDGHLLPEEAAAAAVRLGMPPEAAGARRALAGGPISFDELLRAVDESGHAQPRTLRRGATLPVPRRGASGGDGGRSSSDADASAAAAAQAAFTKAAAATAAAAAAAESPLVNLVLVEGETVLLRAPHASRLDVPFPTAARGFVFLTNYRLAFRPYRTLGQASCSADAPYGCVAEVGKGRAENVARVRLKDGLTLRLAFDARAAWADGFVEQLTRRCFPPGADQTQCFAFSHRVEAGPPLADGWNAYDPPAELERLGLLPAAGGRPGGFRLVTSNLRYELSPTYPSLFVVPAGFDDEQLRAVAAFRSRGRIPAVVWLHPVSGASLSRSSQPLAGVRGVRDRCEEDEALLSSLRRGGVGRLHIIDARPYRAALGNAVMGRGYEVESNYPDTSLHFAGVDNIHHVSAAYRALGELLASEAAGAVPDEEFLPRLEATAWLRLLRLVLRSADAAARLLERGRSVLVHCSDGWDRTSQTVALAELCLDPFYRTTRGLFVLVEKEWCSFGHQFARRSSHLSARPDDQVSPVFLQFVDCVYQLTRQFPTEFEFNGALLAELADHSYSCRFGTFLFNSERERRAASAHRLTTSLWTYLGDPRHEFRFRNPLYAPGRERLVPETSGRAVVLWEAYHARHYRPGHAVAAAAFEVAPEEAVVWLGVRYRLLLDAVRRSGVELDTGLGFGPDLAAAAAAAAAAGEDEDDGGGAPVLAADEARAFLASALNAREQRSDARRNSRIAPRTSSAGGGGGGGGTAARHVPAGAAAPP